VHPEILLWRAANLGFDEFVHANRIRGVVAGREILPWRKGLELVAPIVQATGEVGNNLTATHLSDAAGRDVGDGRFAEEGEHFRHLGALGLVGSIPDEVAFLEGAQQVAEVVEMDRDLEMLLSNTPHDRGDDGIVGIAVEGGERNLFVDDTGPEFEQGDVGGDDESALAGRDSGAKMFDADYPMGRQAMSWRPPGGAGFEHAQGKRLVVSEGEAPAFRGREFGEGEAEVGGHDATANGNEVVDDESESDG